MARAPAASDVFNAIAEPRRRALVEAVSGRELAVEELVRKLGWDQPTVSKHLRVLRDVELVQVRRQGRQRLYRANPEALEPVREWMEQCEKLWNRHLDAIQLRAEGRARG